MSHRNLLFGNVVLGGLLSSACLFLGFAAGAAETNVTQLNVTGSLVSVACKVAMDSLTQDVEFGSVPVKAFLNAGSTGILPESFSLNLTDCMPGAKVKVMLNSDLGEDANVPDAYALSGNQTVALRLFDPSVENGFVYAPGRAWEGDIDATDFRIPLSATLVTANADNVNAGEFSLSVTATFEYE